MLKNLLRHGFRHVDAQGYEFTFAQKVMRESYPCLLDKWRNEKAAGGLWQNANDHWFSGDESLFKSFVDHVRDRKCLEIGSGPFGHLAPCYWIADRVVIDPLVRRYRDFQVELCEESWLDGMTLIAEPAEQVVDSLVGKVDGFIVTRNALDHTEDWFAVLDTISEYAAPGCWLLIWTDLWHLGGHDEGHHNITRSVAGMDKLLNGMGFDVIKNGARIRQPTEYIEWGRIARKR